MVSAFIGLAVLNSVLLIRGGLSRARDPRAGTRALGWLALVAGTAALLALGFALWRLYFSGEHLW
jgi:hypothetical protein